MSAYTCQECGDESDKYIAFILYDCSECKKKNICGSCMEWNNFNMKNKQPFCPECYDKKAVCCSMCCTDYHCGDPDFSLYKCSSCEKEKICSYCITWVYEYDNVENMKPLCSACIVQQKERIEQLKKIVCSVCINTLDVRCCYNNLNDNLCSKCVILENKTI
jgi:hypothetical protein